MLKAKAKNNKGTSDAGKTGDPRLSNYCRIIGYCVFYNKEAESRRERYGKVFCSSDCYSENWEKHEKECKCPESPLEKPDMYYRDGKPCLNPHHWRGGNLRREM